MSRGRFIALSVFVDALLVNAGFVLAFFIRFQGQLPDFNFNAYLAIAPWLTLAYLASLYVFGLYEPERVESPWSVASSVARAVTLGTILTAALSFFFETSSFSRLVILLSWPVNMGIVAGWRLIALVATPIRWPEQRVLIVGTGRAATELARELGARRKWGYTVTGFVTAAAGTDDVAVDGGAALAGPVLGEVSELSEIVEEYGADRVIITSPAAHREILEDVALDAQVRIDVIPELYEIFMGRVDTVVSDIPLMGLTKGPAPAWFSTLKRLADVALSLVLLAFLGWVVALAAVAVLVSMGWPVFFTQERVGRGQRPFKVFKLRTMIRDAERGSGPVLATKDDPRITPVGRFLRRYRIDELPQLFNILLGDMSFVGPRPERPAFVERFIDEIPGYRERFKVKPGATGLAQVSGSYATTPDRKLKYDLIYMYHQSLLMDFQILVETIRVVLTGRGAR